MCSYKLCQALLLLVEQQQKSPKFIVALSKR
nr:MAG TPA_asm: hypothetical protein [Caudoviricetes sp.]DAV04344.1 MAG TPA: hypothetical protein [Caudoviricetes sp.]